jgi:myo-inositol-1(or 4)-monophosphatase
VCAGALLVEEAGGRATDVAGRAFRYNHPEPRVHGVVASNGALHDELLAAAGGLEGER